MNKKTAFLNEIVMAGYPKKEVILGLDAFFTGNNDPCSIGVNLEPQLTPKEFYDVLLKIRSFSKTENIFVRISDVEDTDWFYTDTVYITGEWTLEEIKKMTEVLSPSEIYDGWMYGKPINIPETLTKVHSIWWD